MSQKRFSTFEGVFTPSLLSILGVIMYLRLGWVVGQTGLGRALLIILISNLITIATALSMSSVVTNIRIGTGGAYSIITKSLGVEAGGAIGLPLYLSQAISVAFYITGFTEIWLSVFPGHAAVMVSMIVWLALLVVSYISARLAFRLQYVIMAIILLSLVSIFWGVGDLEAPLRAGHGLQRVSFWAVFAIFFPAVTGILAGASMSGELNDPRRSIPNGTLTAIGTSFVIYIALAIWLAQHVSAKNLVSNPTILIDLGRWRSLVVAGVMGATLSSALSMFVGAPRVLNALAGHRVVPFSGTFQRLNTKGEPAAAILMTALLALVTLLLGTLDSVAGLLTIFFLITYGMINISVFIEQSIGIISFRPSFRIPRWVSFLGGGGCLGAMFLINWVFSLVAIIGIIGVYIYLLRREIKFYNPDIRSGMLFFLAEKFAWAASRLPYYPKIWKPNLLIPVHDFKLLKQSLSIIRAVMFPAGRLFCFCAYSDPLPNKKSLPWCAQESRERDQAKQQMESILGPLKAEDLFIETSVVESRDPESACRSVIQVATDRFFPPNTLFYILGEDPRHDQNALLLLQQGIRSGLGIVILKLAGLEKTQSGSIINLWIRQQSPNVDLSVLISLQLMKNWDSRLRIVQAVSSETEIPAARAYLERLKTYMRLPADIEIYMLIGEFRSVLSRIPQADINIFGMPQVPDLVFIREISKTLKTAVLFLRDSEHESAAA